MIYEATIPFRPVLRHITLVDPFGPLPPRRVGRPVDQVPAEPAEAEQEEGGGEPGSGNSEEPRNGSDEALQEVLAQVEMTKRALAEAQAQQQALLAQQVQIRQEVQAAQHERQRLEELLQQMVDVTQDLKTQQGDRLEEMQQVAVELAVAVASHLVYRQLEAGDYPVEELVRKAIKQLEPREAVTVSLHPEDMAALERRLGNNPLLPLDTNEVRIVADATLARGDCRAETGDTSVMTQLEQHLTEIRRDLLHCLPEAQVERRKPPSEEPTLRRYPDRRYTA